MARLPKSGMMVFGAIVKKPHPAIAVRLREAPLLPARVHHYQPVARCSSSDSLPPAFSLLASGKTVDVYVQ